MAASANLTKTLIVLGLLLAMAGIAAAADLEATYKSVTGYVVAGKGSFATYTLTISNSGPGQTVNIRTLDSLDWEVTVEPSVNNRVELAQGQQGVYLLRVREVKREGIYSKPLGSYKLTVIVEAGEEKITLPVIVNVVSQDSLVKQYPPDLLATADVNVKSIDPRNSANVKILLQNLNLRNLTRIDITILSEKGLVEKRGVATLGPLEEKIVDFTISFDESIAPQKDTLYVKVETIGDDGQVYPKKQPEPIEFEIISYATILRDHQVENRFMKEVITETVSNDGNIKKEAEIRLEASLLDRLFTTTTPKGDFAKEDGKYYYLWNIELDAKEGNRRDSEVFTITKNYRPILVIIIALIVMVVLYYRLRSPIVIVKDVSKVLAKEGGIAGLKIIIHLKNRSERTLENIKIVDKIPTIAEVERDFEVGTLRPTAITKGRSAISISWDLAALEPYEERLITYHVKSRLSVLGGFNLQHAVVKYVTKKGKEVIVTSNKVDMRGILIE